MGDFNTVDNFIQNAELAYIPNTVDINNFSSANDDNFSNINWNNNLITCQRIEDINKFTNLNSYTRDIVNIYKELTDLSELNTDNSDKMDENEEIKKHKEKINKFIESFKEIKNDFIIELNKYKDIEAEYKINYEKLQSDINKINDFKEFSILINTKYEDINIKDLNEQILKITEEIKENNSVRELESKYRIQNYMINLYLNNFIREINSCNSGNTCSLCLQRPVDVFMEPCGHTGCSECINKMKERTGEYNCNCFLCRKTIIKFHKLYFT